MKPLLSVQFPKTGLVFGSKRLFPGLRFTWNRGEHWGILGPNGCGKSVLTQLLAGNLFRPEIEVEYGFEGPNHSDPERAIATVSLERQATLLAEMDAYVQMRWNASEEEATPTLSAWLSQDAVEDRAPYERTERPAASVRAFARRSEALVKEMKIGHLLDRHLASLSNGETRRSLLARALLADPRVLLFDAPYIGLDADSRAILSNAIDREIDGGKASVLVATVRREELPPGLTHLLELDAEGRVVSCGPARSARGAVNHHAERTQPPAGNGPTVFRQKGPAPDPRARPLVEMRDVSVAYGDHVVFGHLDWSIRTGERWLLTGPNGCGKTTLLAFIIGDHPQAYANDVRLFGRRRGTGESIWDIKKKLGWVSPELHACTDRLLPVLNVVLSGFQDTPFYTDVRTKSRIAKAREALAAVGLSGHEEEAFGALSGGAQRLVLLARAIVKKPPLLVLDEPCQNLDAKNRRRFVDLVDRLCAERPGMTLLYVTHLSDTEPRSITHRLTAKG